MTTPATPSAPKRNRDDRHVAVDENYVALTFEDRLRIFWQKNSRTVIILIVAVLLVILANGGWEYLEAQKEQGIQHDYAAASTPEKLKAFALAHEGHALAGLAQLQLADEAYAAGKATDAVSGYEAALAVLKSGPLASRAKLGLAMARIQAGKTAEGEAALKTLAADTTESKGIRVEASYQLASLASVAGKADDVRKYSELVMQIDPSSSWLQRVFLLSSNLPAEERAPTAGVVPTVKLPGTGK